MPYPNNTARAVFEFTLANGSLGYVTPHFRTFDGSDYSSATVQDLAEKLDDWFTNADFEGETNTQPQLIMSDRITLNTITVTSLDPTAPPQFVQSVNATGANTSAPLPNESALVVTLYTGIVGKSFRGRNYWPILASNYMDDDGTILSATLATIQGAFNALVEGFVNDGVHVVAVHSPTLLQVNQAISAVARDTVHHQRRRNQ